jgi:hypothetical protein
MGEIKRAYKISVEKLEEKDLLEDIGINGTVTMRRAFGRSVGGYCLDSSSLDWL